MMKIYDPPAVSIPGVGYLRQSGNQVFLTNDGGILLSGSSSVLSADQTSLLIKLSSSGEIEWTKSTTLKGCANFHIVGSFPIGYLGICNSYVSYVSSLFLFDMRGKYLGLFSTSCQLTKVSSTYSTNEFLLLEYCSSSTHLSKLSLHDLANPKYLWSVKLRDVRLSTLYQSPTGDLYAFSSEWGASYKLHKFNETGHIQWVKSYALQERTTLQSMSSFDTPVMVILLSNVEYSTSPSNRYAIAKISDEGEIEWTISIY
jgi:hypothetical protein